MRTEQEVKQALDFIRGNIDGSIYSYVEAAFDWVLCNTEKQGWLGNHNERWFRADSKELPQ